MALNLYVFMRRLIQKLRIFSSGILDEGVDGESLALLTERAHESLVDKFGPRMKLMRLIKMMKTNSSSHGSTDNESNSDLFIASSSTQNSMGFEESSCSSSCSSPLPISSER